MKNLFLVKKLQFVCTFKLIMEEIVYSFQSEISQITVNLLWILFFMNLLNTVIKEKAFSKLLIWWLGFKNLVTKVHALVKPFWICSLSVIHKGLWFDIQKLKFVMMLCVMIHHNFGLKVAVYKSSWALWQTAIFLL